MVELAGYDPACRNLHIGFSSGRIHSQPRSIFMYKRFPVNFSEVFYRNIEICYTRL